MYVHTPRVFLNLAHVASATRAGNLVRVHLNTPAAPVVEVNHPDDAEVVWKALATRAIERCEFQNAGTGGTATASFVTAPPTPPSRPASAPAASARAKKPQTPTA